MNFCIDVLFTLHSTAFTWFCMWIWREPRRTNEAASTVEEISFWAFHLLFCLFQISFWGYAEMNFISLKAFYRSECVKVFDWTRKLSIQFFCVRVCVQVLCKCLRFTTNPIIDIIQYYLTFKPFCSFHWCESHHSPHDLLNLPSSQVWII